MTSESLRPRSRKVKILATLGPASSSPAMIRRLMELGADAFRINMSHGDHEQKAELVQAIRALEKEFKRPTTILFDLQGPKLRVGNFKGGEAELKKGDSLVFDRDTALGDSKPGRASAPRIVRQRRRRRPVADRRRQDPAEGDGSRRGPDRHQGDGRRAGVRPQGRQRPRRRRSDPGADRQGPRST